MNLYGLIKLVHLFGALGLFIVIGSEWATHLALAKARTTGEVQRILPGFALAKMTGPFSGIFVLLPGLYLTHQISGWTQAWVHIALAAVVTLGILGGVVSGKRIRALGAGVAGADRPLTPDLIAKIHEPILWTGFALRTTIVSGVVVLMYLKPDVLTSVAVMLVSIGLGFAFGGMLNRRTAENSTGVGTSPGGAT